MKAQLLALSVIIVVWAMLSFAQEPEGEETAVLPDDLKEMDFELDAGAEVETRGLSNIGTISEIHHNAKHWHDPGSGKRETCIKMNPSIPNNPWACLYSQASDPRITHLRGISRTSSEIHHDYQEFRAMEEYRRLLHDAFIHNKKCQIWYDPGTHNRIRIISCFNP